LGVNVKFARCVIGQFVFYLSHSLVNGER
jgi:hypothetical protein